MYFVPCLIFTKTLASEHSALFWSSYFFLFHIVEILIQIKWSRSLNLFHTFWSRNEFLWPSVKITYFKCERPSLWSTSIDASTCFHIYLFIICTTWDYIIISTKLYIINNSNRLLQILRWCSGAPTVRRAPKTFINKIWFHARFQSVLKILG